MALQATGFDNIAPARLDLMGDDALYVGCTYFKQVELLLSSTAAAWDLSSGIASWQVYLKNRPEDADADAVSSGSVFSDDSTFASGIVAFGWPDDELVASAAGQLWWSLSLVTTTGSYVVPVLYGEAELREFP